MIKMNFPHKLKYRIEKAKPGIVSLGSDDEPIITVYGRGIYLQYRLISFTKIEETYNQGELTEEEIIEIEDRIEDECSKLCVEANIRHYVQFVDDSPCYYDFRTEKLYGANGVREKKGPIKGEPFTPSSNVKCFIEKMTETPGAQVNALEILEKNHYAENSFGTIWSNFRKLDSSIRSTFSHVSHGKCIYAGNAQTWQVVEKIEASDEASDFTLAIIFSGIAYRKIVATFDTESGTLHASLREDMESKDILTFLGMDSDAFDPSFVDAEKLIQKNYYDSADRLEALLKTYTGILEAVWNRLIKKIENNLAYTFRAASYYEETLNIPKQASDLTSYEIRLHTHRWNNALERACQWVKSMLQSTRAGTDFFMYCKKEVNADSVIDYISAFILISFSYCKTPTKGEEAMKIKEQYKKKLLGLIQKKFDFSPPSNGKESIIEEIQSLLAELLSETRDTGMDASISKLVKINDLVNLLGYNDSNSLLSPSIGREL